MKKIIIFVTILCSFNAHSTKKPDTLQSTLSKSLQLIKNSATVDELYTSAHTSYELLWLAPSYATSRQDQATISKACKDFNVTLAQKREALARPAAIFLGNEVGIGGCALIAANAITCFTLSSVLPANVDSASNTLYKIVKLYTLKL